LLQRVQRQRGAVQARGSTELRDDVGRLQPPHRVERTPLGQFGGDVRGRLADRAAAALERHSAERAALD